MSSIPSKTNFQFLSLIQFAVSKCFFNWYMSKNLVVWRFTLPKRVPHGSVVKCLTHNPGVLGSSHTGSSGFFLGQDTSDPSLVLVKPRKDMNNVSCRHDMTEILLKVAENTIQSTNHFTKNSRVLTLLT